MERKLICRCCKKEIDTHKDRFVHVEDFNKKKMINEDWFHSACFKQAMNRDLTLLEKKANFMLHKANNIFNSVVGHSDNGGMVCDV